MTTKDESQMDIQIIQKESQVVNKNLNIVSQTAQRLEGLLAEKSADSYCDTIKELAKVETKDLGKNIFGKFLKDKEIYVKRLDEEKLNQDLKTAKDITHDLVESISSLKLQHSGPNIWYKNEEEILGKLQEILDTNERFKEFCDGTTKKYLDEVDQKIEDIKVLLQGQDDFIMPQPLDGIYSS